MKIGIIPENLVERLALALGLVPAPALESWFSFMLSRAIMAGTKLVGVRGACTAGLVLKDDSALSGLTEYRRSVRVVLTAGHCGNSSSTSRAE